MGQLDERVQRIIARRVAMSKAIPAVKRDTAQRRLERVEGIVRRIAPEIEGLKR